MPGESDQAILEERFEEAYERLSEQGACDSPAGMEFKRVREEWRRLGRPHNIDEFIRIRANVPPDAPELFPRPNGES